MARQPDGSALRAVLPSEFVYDGIETCAADGSCMLACPLAIDTGKLVKELRDPGARPRAERVGLAASPAAGARSRSAPAAACARGTRPATGRCGA